MSAFVLENILEQAKQLEIYAKKIYETQLSGIYKSVFKGSGQIFKEIRPYVVGDDLRRLDHKVTARLGKPFLRLYEEEREVSVWLAVDVSRSMQFGLKQTQRELAQKLTAVLAYAAIAGHDRCGLILFSDKVLKVIPPEKSKSQLLRIIETLLSQECAGQTSLTETCHFVLRTIKKKCLLFLISDFNVAENDLALLKTLDLRYEFLPIVVSGFGELNVKKRYWFNDLESNKSYLMKPQQTQNLDLFFKKINLPYLALRTRDDYLPLLSEFLNQHAFRK